MDSKEDLSKLDRLKQKTKKVKESKYSILIYVGTIFVASLWLIFMNPCLMNLVLPILAILIPYKLYEEKDLKKIVATGVIVIILLAASTTLFQLGFIYDQPDQILRSENLQDGTVEPLYGDSSTTFNFTVNLTENFAQEWDSKDYTVYVNLTLSTIGGIGREPYEEYEMNGTEDEHMYYKEVSLEERLFGHRFSLRRNVTDEMTYLFSLRQTEYEDYLNESTISPELREAFEDEGHDVDEDAELEEDREWFVVEDDERRYRIEIDEDDEELNIYDILETDGPEDELERPFYTWERTSVGYGPVTIERTRAFQLLVGEYIISTSVVYLLGVGILWWKTRMDSSIEDSTEGLEEKEKELEDHCPECGSLLEGSEICERCGWEKGTKEKDRSAEFEEEPTDEEDKDT